MIYLDNAATTFTKPPQVARAVYEAFFKLGNAGRGAYSPTLEASRLLFDTRRKLAQLFGAPDPARIAFTMNVTEALNIAVSGLVRAPGTHAVCSECDHNSVLRPLYRRQEAGASLTILKADSLGKIRMQDLEADLAAWASAEERKPAASREPAAFSPPVVILGHVSNLTGNVIDLKEASRIVHRFDGILVADAAQSAGEIPIDVTQMGIDVLCFTGHKALFGPQGTGGIYVREGLKIPPLKVGGSGVQSYNRRHPSQMPAALEAGTQNAHGLAGLNAAVSFLLDTGVERIHEKTSGLAALFAEGVRSIPGITLYGDYDAPLRAPIVTLNIGSMDAGQVSDILWEDYEICTRAGAHCAPLMHKALGTAGRGAVRFSFSWFNTEEEVRTAVRAVREIARDA